MNFPASLAADRGEYVESAHEEWYTLVFTSAGCYCNDGLACLEEMWMLGAVHSIDLLGDLNR